MKPFALLLAVAPLAFPQALPDVLTQGEAAFAKTCGNGYCHGTKGGGGGAPRLAARGFDQTFIRATITNGIPGTQMAAFGKSMSAQELTSIVAYVATLNGVTNPEIATPGRQTEAPAPASLSAEAARGKTLFSEAARGFQRCSTCHEAAEIGVAVTTPIANIPQNAAALKALPTGKVKTTTMNGESMPVLVLSDGRQGAVFYDLTSAPPVERHAEPGSVKFSEGSAWRHSVALGTYSDSELNAVLAYLRAVGR